MNSIFDFTEAKRGMKVEQVVVLTSLSRGPSIALK